MTLCFIGSCLPYHLAVPINCSPTVSPGSTPTDLDDAVAIRYECVDVGAAEVSYPTSSAEYTATVNVNMT